MASWPRSVNLSKRIFLEPTRKFSLQDNPSLITLDCRSLKVSENQRGDRRPRHRPALRIMNASALSLCCLCFFGFGLDRSWRCAVSLNFNAARLRLFTLWQRHAKNAIAVFSVRSFGRDRIRQRERASKTSVSTLNAMIVVRFVFLFEMTLTSKRDDVVLDREIEILALHARQLSFQHDVIFIFVNVNAGTPRTTRDALVVEAASDVARKEAIDFLLKRPKIAERVIANDTHKSNPPECHVLSQRPISTLSTCQ